MTVRQEKFHIRLKRAMASKNITQTEIVEKTSIHKSTLSQYVSGKIIPRQNALEELAKLLNVSEPWLMGYNVSMDRNSLDKPSDDNIQLIARSINDLDEAKMEQVKNFIRFLKDNGGK